jgi:hypothetical protein
LRQRQKVQELPRNRFVKTITLLFLSVLAGRAAILPGIIGPWKFVSRAPLEIKSNQPLWEELGLQESEQGVYKKGAVEAHVEAWRLADATEAMGAFDFLVPPDAKPAHVLDALTPNAALTGGGVLLASGNYLVAIHGFVPEADEAADMFRRMPRYENSPLPNLPLYLPEHEIPNTERYVGGPEALKLFFPGIQPSLAGFRYGAEAVVADYPSGLRMALFSYPLPAAARDRAAEFSKIPDAFVKRTGPLVAVVLHPTNGNLAEALLAKVRYQATVTTGQPPKSRKDDPADLLLNIFYLIGILILLCLASGIMFGLIRLFVIRSRATGEEEEILTLHLERR